MSSNFDSGKETMGPTQADPLFLSRHTADGFVVNDPEQTATLLTVEQLKEIRDMCARLGANTFARPR